MVFPAVMYGCESWIIKKPEHQRFDDFELWYWRRLLRIPWTARRSKQLILTEISPEYSLEGLMLKLKLQRFGHLMWSTDSLEKTLMLEKIEGWMRRGQERMRWLHGITDSITWVWASKLGDGQGSLVFCSPWGCKESDVTEWLNWTTNKITPRKKKFHCQWENIENDISVLIKVRLLGNPNEWTWSNEQLRRQELVKMVKKTKSLQELNCKESDKDWITSPLPNSYVEVLIPNVAVLGDRTF